jgi:hypothetical protein
MLQTARNRQEARLSPLSIAASGTASSGQKQGIGAKHFRPRHSRPANWHKLKPVQNPNHHRISAQNFTENAENRGLE